MRSQQTKSPWICQMDQQYSAVTEIFPTRISEKALPNVLDHAHLHIPSELHWRELG